MKIFNEYNNFNLSDINKDILAKWIESNLFEQSMSTREGCPSFVFYEGPPSANGMPGIHHVMARTIKDVFCRYKTMKGFHVKRKAGWDTHGLPVELGVEKSLGITKEDIGKKISVDEYNAACRREVMKYTKEWSILTTDMGYWVDLDNPYITYDNRYIETVWWLLAQLYKKGYLYKGYTIQPYSPAAGTGLSTHELNQPGCYRDVTDTTATALFRIVNPNDELAEWGTAYFAAWTTTPWTLPSNTALCVGPKVKYVALRTFNPYTAEPITVILAEARLSAYFKPQGADAPMEEYNAGDKIIPYRIVASYDGSDLVGMKYEQLYQWVKPLEQKEKNVFSDRSDDAFRVIPGDYVTTDDGTGIVHIAPTFGADDARVAKAAGVPSLFMINRKGETRPMVDFSGKYFLLDDCDPDFVARFVNVEQYSDFAGKYVKNAFDPKYNLNGKYDEEAAKKDEDLNVLLSILLKKEGKALKVEKHVHNYPHCWRTDKPVLYYPLDSWFIRSTSARERMMQLNETIKWKPQTTGTGRFGKWLENIQDWNLSRSRYWGTPLPIWRTEDGDEEICVDSIATLYNEIERAVAAGIMTSNPYKDKGFIVGDYSVANYEKIDLHRPYVDDIILVSKNGKPMRRETDLIDVWFDSGSMPYAQLHYPFENREAIDSGNYFPADFIAEGVDQTRGWFFTMHAIATMVFDSVAYKAVISNGLVLDKNGDKMSKRKGNAVDPFEAIEKFGSDPLRWYMIANSAPWDNLRFDTAGVAEASRKLFSTLYNTYSFFALYANVDNFDPSNPQVPIENREEIDRWILSLLNSLVKTVEDALNDYEPTRAARAINDFVGENLSNWYVRLNRKRFWGGGVTENKLAAYQTLYTCLLTVAKLIAPIAPFYADRLYTDLTNVDIANGGSVHLSSFPTVDESLINPNLEKRMAIAQTITSMVLALRRKVSIKVRQPLSKLMIPVVDDSQRADIEAVLPLILNEVNVKEVDFINDEDGILVKRVKPDFKKLGPRYGKIMKALSSIIKDLDQKSIGTLEREGSLTIDVDGTPAVITTDDVEIFSEDIPGWLVNNEGNITVALDVTITDQLRQEGIARDIVNRIQSIRKDRDYNITDKIRLLFQTNASTDKAIAAFSDYIASQVLADELIITDSVPGNAEELTIDDITLHVSIEKL